MKRVIVLGATGSIGSSTLRLIKDHPQDLALVGATAHSNFDKLKEIATLFNIKNGIFSTKTDEDALSKVLDIDCDIVVNGISGSPGLKASIMVLEKGRDLALANKETIVMAGNLIKKLAAAKNLKILPVDSEHSAIFTLIEKIGGENVSEIILTASGGPFKNLPKEQLENVTVARALNHPTWKMGPKITIDSASLANKGLEVIEAKWLFDVPEEKIKVVIHPQSLVHSFVRTHDGILYGQISKPDMRQPIFAALTHPNCLDSGLPILDLWETGSLEFSKPRFEDFPMLSLAYDAAKYESTSIAYNAANEVAVAAFLNEEISFTDIPRICGKVLADFHKCSCENFLRVFELDERARKLAYEGIRKC